MRRRKSAPEGRRTEVLVITKWLAPRSNRRAAPATTKITSNAAREQLGAKRSHKRCPMGRQFPKASERRTNPVTAKAQCARMADAAGEGVSGRDLNDLKRALALRDQALALLGHDLRNPLTAV